jgi:thiol-disulfide isomerase/thioredoxin
MVTEITMNEMTTGVPLETFNDMYVIMFYGETCGPCKATMPHYETVANLYKEKNAHIQFFKINTWAPEEQKVYCSNIWGINGVPHFKVFCRSEQVIEKVGGGDEEAMKQFIQDAIYETLKKFQEKM